MIRIAVSADDQKGLDSVVNPHFGRCPFFVIVDLEDEQVKTVCTVPNPFYGQHQPGQVPRFIYSQGANVMLTGGMGGRALTFFADYGIEPITGASGTVREALEHLLAGELLGAAPCQESIQHGHAPVLSQGEYEKDQVGRLKEEAGHLQRQLDEVTTLLSRLKQ